MSLCLYWLYLKHVYYKRSYYAWKWSVIFHYGAGRPIILWAKCTAEHQRTASVVLPIPFVNMDPNNISTIYIWIMYAAEQRNKCGWSCINITFDHPLNANLVMQERWFWLSGNVVLFPASSFGSEDFTACFRPWVLPVQLWLEMVPMHSACARPFIIWKRE